MIIRNDHFHDSQQNTIHCKIYFQLIILYWKLFHLNQQLNNKTSFQPGKRNLLNKKMTKRINFVTFNF